MDEGYRVVPRDGLLYDTLDGSVSYEKHDNLESRKAPETRRKVHA